MLFGKNFEEHGGLVRCHSRFVELIRCGFLLGCPYRAGFVAACVKD